MLVCTIIVTMSALLIILVVSFLLIIGAGVLFFWILSQRQISSATRLPEESSPQVQTKKKVGFRWSYILLPLSILIISVIVSIIFYGQLPLQIDIRNHIISRTIITVWAILPQVLLTLMSVTIAWGMGKIHFLIPENEPGAGRIGTIMMVMSNMVAIPQLILFFVMLDVFTYNAFQRHISFLWAFTLSIILIGIIILGIFFIRIINNTRKESK